jgi:septum formation protein
LPHGVFGFLVKLRPVDKNNLPAIRTVYNNRRFLFDARESYQSSNGLAAQSMQQIRAGVYAQFPIWYNAVSLEVFSERGEGMETALSKARIILASGSPRRRELMAYFGIPFAVVASAIDEKAEGSGAEQAQRLARDKGLEVYKRCPGYPVLSADTLVCLGSMVLGKPRSRAEAARMLSMLSERWHQVVTGVCLLTPDGAVRERLVTSSVLFRKIGEKELLRYAASREPMDKAGAYAMQGTGSIFIDRIDGSPSNVIGLPLCTVAELLTDANLYP